MKGGRKENSKQEKDLAQIEGQIFPRAKCMNTEPLSPNDSPCHVATAAPCVCLGGEAAQEEQICGARELVVSTRGPHIHTTRTDTKQAPKNPQQRHRGP